MDKIDSDNDSGIEEKFEKMRVNYLANEKFCLRASLRTFLNDNESGHTPTVATPIKQGNSLNEQLNQIYKIRNSLLGCIESTK